jgi:HTH-type transcriptional regulator / antitoxin HigA
VPKAKKVAKKVSFPFDPDWVIAPGETLKEWMEDNRIPSASTMGVMCGRMPTELVEGILAGRTKITEPIAQGLQLGTGIPARLWLNLEGLYRKGLAAGKTPLS